MGSSDVFSAQRARSKDIVELFRSANGARQTPRTGAGTGSSPSSSPVPGEKPAVTKASSRRSMLPFLGRKRPVEQTGIPALPMSRKSVGSAAYSNIPVNTVRRSFGNGHAVLMITPSSQSLPAEPPLPSKFSSMMDTHTPSLGSKLAAHFTPLRSPARNSKVLHSVNQKLAVPAPPLPSPAALSPPVPRVRAPSIESQRSSLRSRSTTPRPLRGPFSLATENGDEEDFSDLFTLPDQPKKPQQFPTTSSATSAHLHLGESPKKSGELTPTTPLTPLTPLGPPLHFPIPPSTIVPPRSLLTDKSSLPRYSTELASLSSQGSKSPSTRPSPARVDSGRTRQNSQDDRRNRHRRNTSVSGSDTDTSRVNDSTYSPPAFKLSPVVPRPPSVKSKHSSSSVTRASSGPPPSAPLPSPPVTPNPAVLGPRSAPSYSPNRVAFPRPRANTLSITTNLAVPVQALPKPSHSSPPRSARSHSDAMQDATVDELREAFSQQRRKNVQLQEYIVTLTKRYEDDRVAMTKNIEKLERNVRKKMREIEGLRWLVIHNGAVSDIDAATNLARSSLSTQDGDAVDAIPAPSTLPSASVAASHHQEHLRHHPFMSGRKVGGITMAAADSITEFRSGASSSATSISATSISETSSLSTVPSLTLIPERIDRISRAERQRLKEERRASKALRRISAASSLVMGTDILSRSMTADSPVNPNFDPKQSMDEVLEKLEPFRHS